MAAKANIWNGDGAAWTGGGTGSPFGVRWAAQNPAQERRTIARSNQPDRKRPAEHVAAMAEAWRNRQGFGALETVEANRGDSFHLTKGGNRKQLLG